MIGDKKATNALTSIEWQMLIDIKPGLYEPQLPVERNVTLIFFIAVERHCCTLQVSSVAWLQENKETWRSTQPAVVVRINQA